MKKSTQKVNKKKNSSPHSYQVRVTVVPKETKCRLFIVESKRERAKTLKEYSKERAELKTMIDSW